MSVTYPDRPEESPDPNADGPTGTPGGQPPEKVSDRPNVGTVTPDDYPKDEPNH